MPLRRGFKSEAERTVERVRSDLGLSAVAPIDPTALGQLLGVEICAGDELIPRERFRDLDRIQPGSFSACTLQPSPERLVVVYNPISSLPRRWSDLAHELAHILLDHKLGRIEKLGDMTFRSCDATQEEEANWLSGCLLLPRPLLLNEVGQGLDEKQIADKYGVSVDMARYRLNVTGVARQHKARRRRRA